MRQAWQPARRQRRQRRPPPRARRRSRATDRRERRVRSALLQRARGRQLAHALDGGGGMPPLVPPVGAGLLDGCDVPPLLVQILAPLPAADRDREVPAAVGALGRQRSQLAHVIGGHVLPRRWLGPVEAGAVPAERALPRTP